MTAEEPKASSPRTAATASQMLGSFAAQREARPTDRRWQDLIARVDGSVATGEPTAMLRAWQSASLAALLDRTWESMAAVGDAAIRVGRATGLRTAFDAKARQAYHVALYRAQKDANFEGVIAAADGFAELGDLEIVDQCLAVAIHLTTRSKNVDWDRLESARTRLTSRR